MTQFIFLQKQLMKLALMVRSIIFIITINEIKKLQPWIYPLHNNVLMFIIRLRSGLIITIKPLLCRG